MKMILALALLCAYASAGPAYQQSFSGGYQQAYSYVPTYYATQTLQKPQNGETFRYTAQLCPNEGQYYNGQYATVYINFPYNLDFSAQYGYVVLSVYATNTKKFLCSNYNANGQFTSSCSFKYHSSYGNSFTFVAKAFGNPQFTFGIQFNDYGRVFDHGVKFPYHSYNFTDFENYDWYFEYLMPYVRFNYGGQVTTNNYLYYFFSVCSRPYLYQNYAARPQNEYFHYTTFGTTPYSAFSTYFCYSADCYPGSQNDFVTYDQSYSGFNHGYAPVSSFKSGFAYFTFAGYGGTQVSSFEFAVRYFVPGYKFPYYGYKFPYFAEANSMA